MRDGLETGDGEASVAAGRTESGRLAIRRSSTGACYSEFGKRQQHRILVRFILICSSVFVNNMTVLLLTITHVEVVVIPV